MARNENIESTESTELSPLARLAGAFLLASSLFALAAVVAYGTWGIKNPWGWSFTVLTAITGGAFLIGRKQQAKIEPDEFAKQRVLLGVNAVTSALLVAVLLIGVNYVAGRRVKTFDLTKNKINSLAPQSLDVLSKLKKPVELKLIFMRPDPTVQALLENYKRESSQIQVTYLNVARRPMDAPPTFTGQPMLVASEVAQGGKDKDGKPITTKGAEQEISQIDEQGITSALMKLGNPEPKRIYFLAGHGEVDPSQAALAGEALKAQNYDVKTFSFYETPKVPADAAAILVLSPQTDLRPQDVKTLTAYVGGKGRLVLMGGIAKGPMPNWTSLLKGLGLKWGNGYVIQPEMGQLAQYAVGRRGDVTRHPIVRGTSADVLFPACQAYTTITPAPTGITVTPIFESDPTAVQMTTSGAQAGQPGSFVLAAAVEKGESRILVTGSGSIALDQMFPQAGDKSFFLAAVNWVVGNDALVSIPPKPEATNTLDPPGRTWVLFGFFSVLVCPVLALIAGAVVWFQRR